MRTLVLLACLTLVASPAHAQRRTTSLIQHAAITTTTDLRIESREPLTRFLAPDCDLDRTRGREAADLAHSGGGWMAGGFVSGILLGLIGTGVTWAMANSSSVEVERVPDGVESSCYREGYASKARGKNTSNALTGGLLGTAVLVLLVVSASSSY